ncbi:hypothetical protein Scep_028065 [Stephania cephalantha]|uniref:Uncharacterized protein n=1 Tax=Stephania cephalantha TaxID=152367 RepID=A0AAP0ECQ8_9MAGN
MELASGITTGITTSIDNWEILRSSSLQALYTDYKEYLSHVMDSRMWGWESSQSSLLNLHFMARVFAWMAWLGKINTADVLQRRCPNHTMLPSRCYLCPLDCETIIVVLSFLLQDIARAEGVLGLPRTTPQSLKG